MCKCTWVHVILGIDNSGPHAGEECVCLVGVVFGVQWLTFFFFFFFTCNTPRNTRQTRGMLSLCPALAMPTIVTLTRFTLLRGSLSNNCQLVFSTSELAFAYSYSASSEIMWQTEQLFYGITKYNQDYQQDDFQGFIRTGSQLHIKWMTMWNAMKHFFVCVEWIAGVVCLFVALMLCDLHHICE